MNDSFKYAVVKPKEGFIVRDPLSGLKLPAEGKKVKLSNYWNRRIADGDVDLVNIESGGE